jgi:5,6-dimethylbenzimidazole synthase
MELLDAIKGRRSCRDFLADKIDKENILKLIDAAVWAPSPLNLQPWEFMVITKKEIINDIYNEALRCKKWGEEVSGWSWLGKYSVEFLKNVPLLIVVVGNPDKTGLDAFLDEGNVGYQYACAAAIQNIHLVAHSLGLSSLWFTLYDKKNLRKILNIPDNKNPLSIVCIGKPASDMKAPKRKNLDDKIVWL